MTKSIKSLVKLHRKWLEKNGARILDRDTAYLLGDLEEGTPEAFLPMPASLDALALYYGILGTVELVDGQEIGWNHISTALDFRGWSLKVGAKSFFRQPGSTLNLTNHVGRAACLICVSEKWGEAAESILREVDRDPDAVDQPYWKSRRFEPFVLECCLIRDGKAPSNDHLEPPYLAVIQNWHDDRALGHALAEVCEYHRANMDDHGGLWDPEFKHPPFDLLPCEVMLVQRIRKQLGLSIPEVSHELISLLSPPDIIGSVGEEHELITKLSAAFSQCFG